MGSRQPRMLAPGRGWRHVAPLDSAQTALADRGLGFTCIRFILHEAHSAWRVPPCRSRLSRLDGLSGAGCQEEIQRGSEFAAELAGRVTVEAG